MLEITMPKLSESMTEGKLLRWCVRQGDLIRIGDAIAEVETDKANMEIESVETGWIIAFDAKPGESVPPGTTIARMATTLEELSGAGPQGPGVGMPEDLEPVEATAAGSVEINASPLAMSLAEQYGIDLGAIHGSGPAGRVMKDDVLSMRPGHASSGLHDGGVFPSGVDGQSIRVENINEEPGGRAAEPDPVSGIAAQSYTLHVTANLRALDAAVPAVMERLDVSSAGPAVDPVLPFVARAAALAVDRTPAFRTGIFSRDAEPGCVAFSVLHRGAFLYPVLRHANVKPLAEIVQDFFRSREKALTGGMREAECAGAEIVLNDFRGTGIDSFSMALGFRSLPALNLGIVGTGGPRARLLSVSLSLPASQCSPLDAACVLGEIRTLLEHPVLLSGFARDAAE